MWMEKVAQIFSVDQVEDICFLVLELMPGETLEERIARGASSARGGSITD